MKSKLYKEYKTAREIRAKKTVRENSVFSKKAKEEARKIAGFLADNYGVNKVVLFGSLAKNKFNQGSSDIDIGVFGLKKRLFFNALAKISQLTELSVDLKPLEDCSPYFRDRVEKEGEVIYEREG